MDLKHITISECDVWTYVLLKGWLYPGCRSDDMRRKIYLSLRKIKQNESVGFGRIHTPWAEYSFNEILWEGAFGEGVRKISYRRKNAKGWQSIARKDIEAELEKGLAERIDNKDYVLKVNMKASERNFHELLFFRIDEAECESTIEIDDGQGGVAGSAVVGGLDGLTAVSCCINFPKEHIGMYSWSGKAYRKIEALWVPESYLEGELRESGPEIPAANSP